MLSDRHKAARVSWAKQNRNTDWGGVVFSDEMSIWLSGGRLCLWCKKDEIAVKLSSKHSPKLHVWGAFSARGTFPLKIFRGNLTGMMYSNILNECLVTQANMLYPDGWVFQEDNDLKHTSKVAKEFRKMNGITRTAACSPDLNPIEDLWAWMKGKIDLAAPRTLVDLEVELNKVWNSVETEFLAPYWQSMPNRLRLVKDSKGNKINYYNSRLTIVR